MGIHVGDEVLFIFIFIVFFYLLSFSLTSRSLRRTMFIMFIKSVSDKTESSNLSVQRFKKRL